jgi:hypothetical protein
MRSTNECVTAGIVLHLQQALFFDFSPWLVISSNFILLIHPCQAMGHGWWQWLLCQYCQYHAILCARVIGDCFFAAPIIEDIVTVFFFNSNQLQPPAVCCNCRTYWFLWMINIATFSACHPLFLSCTEFLGALFYCYSEREPFCVSQLPRIPLFWRFLGPPKMITFPLKFHVFPPFAAKISYSLHCHCGASLSAACLLHFNMHASSSTVIVPST